MKPPSRVGGRPTGWGMRRVKPSDLVHKHVYGCFIDDPLGVREREVIGVDRIMWESD
jgi:hypothetical protein